VVRGNGLNLDGARLAPEREDLPALQLPRTGLGFRIHQGAQMQRPSTLYARITGSAARLEAIEVGGAAVTVARG
jgi:predicted PhzF superfamily epimerase YddE/YHI9